jgi:hypothetical protein
MEHYIRKNSQEPILSVDIYSDNDLMKSPMSDRIENSVIVFNMYDEDGNYLILNGECKLLNNGNDYSIVYLWSKKDTSRVGSFTGEFKISFLNDQYAIESEVILPIKEELIVNVI